jgi:23S rRNA (adenine2030-N6)-methyltransferase
VAQARPHFERAKSYAGSPPLLASALREGDELFCFETEPNTYASLTRALEGKRAIIRGEDGMAGLLAAAQRIVTSERDASATTRLFALVDPPWNKKEDWKTIPRATLEVLRAAPTTTLALWYPIKSYTRVIAMMDYFREQGVSGTALDLITTPLSLQRNRLNGSGMLLFNCPLPVIAACSEMATYIGAACATHKGFWEFKASVVC